MDTKASADCGEQEHALYRFWSADGELLYIGLTINPGTRWRHHSKHAPWWREIKRVEVEW